MGAHDAVDAALHEEIELGAAAETAVGEDHVVFFELVPERAEEGALADMKGAFGQLDQHAGAQTKQPDRAHDRKRAPRLGRFRLRIELLQGRRIGHGQAGAVNDFHHSAEPEARRQIRRADFARRRPVDLIERILGQARPGLAVTGRP